MTNSLLRLEAALATHGGAQTLAQLSLAPGIDKGRLLVDLERLQRAGRVMQCEGVDTPLWMPTALALLAYYLRSVEAQLAVANSALALYAPEVEQ